MKEEDIFRFLHWLSKWYYYMFVMKTPLLLLGIVFIFQTLVNSL
jgi:hypothetical protein